MTDRILWNRRPVNDSDAGEVDELVIHDCTVHIEQMNTNCWWIGITKGDQRWDGNFSTKRAPMTFGQQDNEGINLDDRTHEATP